VLRLKLVNRVTLRIRGGIQAPPLPKLDSCALSRLPYPARVHDKPERSIHGNRGTIWPDAWRLLSEAYGGNGALAREVGVSYQTVYRWAAKGDRVPLAMVKLLALLAAAKGVTSPATLE
jgi:hypothetical protein